MIITVIIVNWNSGQQILECVNSVQKCNSSQLLHTIVVDNGSTDKSMKYIQGISNIQLIYAEKNLGFGKACNIGAKHAKSDYLLFLNPDAAIFSDTLDKALAFMNDPVNEDVGICGVQLLDDAGHVSRSCARFPTSLVFVLHALGVDRVLPRLGHFMTEWGHDSTREVDHVIGAFFLVRRKVFESLGGFDERFFVYLEDLDFSYRAHEAGWRSVYFANAQAFHAGGGTSNQVKSRRLFYSLRSRILYAFKHFSLVSAIGVMLTTMLLEPVVRSFVAIYRRSWPTLKQTWGGFGMLWMWFTRWVFFRIQN